MISYNSSWSSTCYEEKDTSDRDTSWGFNNWNVVSNADVLSVAVDWWADDEEKVKLRHAALMRKRDLGYLAKPVPSLKRLRFHVQAPPRRFMPVARSCGQHKAVFRCRRQRIGCRAVRRFCLRNAGLVAVRPARAWKRRFQA